jgi:hypothetical protein
MGWGRWLLLGDFGQQLDLHDAQASVERLRRSLSLSRGTDQKQDHRLDELEGQVLRLGAAFAALAQVLTDKGNVTAAELSAAIDAQVVIAEREAGERSAADDAAAKHKQAELARRRADRRRS